MDESVFYRLSKGVVRSLGDRTLQACSWACNQKGQTNPLSGLRPSWDVDLYASYERWRTRAHQMMQHKFVGDGDGRIDRHKIAAAFMIAILETKPLGCPPDKKQTYPFLVWLANEYLAFHVGIDLVVRFAKSDTNDAEIVSMLSEPFGIPKAIEGDYRLHSYRALYRLTEEPTDSGLLLLANMLFLLESYNLLAKQTLDLTDPS